MPVSLSYESELSVNHLGRTYSVQKHVEDGTYIFADDNGHTILHVDPKTRVILEQKRAAYAMLLHVLRHRIYGFDWVKESVWTQKSMGML